MTAIERDSKLDALGYEAPFLIEKLLREQIVETPEEGEALFVELKRFLVLIRFGPVNWDMYSRRVDEVWHQFVLFTSRYVDFCQRYFGSYVHHSPGVASSPQGEPATDETAEPGEASSFPGFRAAYEEFFGAPLPEIWWDAASVTIRRRILNDEAQRLSVRPGEPGLVDLIASDGEVLLSVSEMAAEALAFIAATPGFYVRELPGDLSDSEKVGIAAALVGRQTLRVAP